MVRREEITKVDKKVVLTKDIVLLLMVFFISLGYLLQFYDKGVDFNDEGATLYIADRVAQGDLLYRDAWWLWTPGVYYLLALSFKILGTSIWTGRVVTALFGALTSVVIYRLASFMVSRPLSLLPSALFAVWGLPFHFQPYHSWFALFFSLASVLAACYYIESKSTRILIVTGALCGLTAFFKINYGGITYLSIAAYLLLADYMARKEGKEGPISPLKGMALLSAGALVVLGPLSLYFYVKGNFWEMIYAVFLAPLEIRQIIAYAIPSPLETLRDFSLARPYNLMMYLPVPVLVGSFLLSSRDDAVRAGRLLLVYLYTLFFLYTAYPTFNWVHFIPVLAPAYLLLVLLVDEALWKARTVDANRKQAHTIILLLLALTAALLLVGGVKNRGDFLREANYTIEFDDPRGGIYVSQAELQNEHITEVLEFMKRVEGEVFVVPNQPLFYFLSERKSPSRFLFSNYATTEAMEREQLEVLERNRVPYIIFFPSSAVTDWGTGKTYFSLTKLRPYIGTYYAMVDYYIGFDKNRGVRGMTIYILKRLEVEDSQRYEKAFLNTPEGDDTYLVTEEVIEKLKRDGLIK